MNKNSIITRCVFLLLVLSGKSSSAQTAENWTKDQLIEPAALSATLNSKKDLPKIFSVGPGAVIPGSLNIGMIKEEQNMAAFKEAVNSLPKSTNIVVYCGCCPFEHCPNVRPAIAFLKSRGFSNYHLLNLPHNIKTDWIAKGYPSVEQ